MGYPRVKRIADFFFALMFSILLSPLLAVICLLLYWSQGRPIFFVQVRPGLGGRLFKVVKFRTMTVQPGEGASTRDESFTPLGKVLRRLSLDELPQLLNILRGEMSFVGPRPLLVDYLKLYSQDQANRHNVRPGLTGLAQVSGRNEISWQARLAADVEYTHCYSLKMDFVILIKTMALVFSGKGVNRKGHISMPRFESEV